MAEPSTAIHGVQELIDRIRDEGIQETRQRAEKILDDARKEAEAILAKAKEEADVMVAASAAEIESRDKSAMEALKLAARDAVLQLKTGVARAFEDHVRRLVTTATMDKELIRTIVLVLARDKAKEVTMDSDLEIMVAKALFEDAELDESLRDRGKKQILSLSGDMLREGVELIPSDDVKGGVRIKLVGEDLEIDLTDEAIADLLIQFMSPRFISILAGEEG